MYDDDNKQEALSIPSCATDITSLFKTRFTGKGQEIRSNFTTKGVADPRKIEQINAVLLAQEVSLNYSSPGETIFYPGGGTDTFYPKLVAQPRIIVMTSLESSWGSLQTITSQPLDLNSIIGSYGGSGGGTFDPSQLLHGITDKGEVQNENPLAHLAFDRAVVAHLISEEKVTRMSIAKVSLNDDGSIVYDKIDSQNIEGDFVFWITSKDARKVDAREKTTAYLRFHLFIPTKSNADQEFSLSKIAAIHKFLANVCPQKQLMMMQKAFPERLLKTEACRKLLSPPQNLIRTILSDQRFGQDREKSNTPTPVFIEEAKMVEKVELARFGTAFGYGDMYIFTTNRLNLNHLYPIDSLSKERYIDKEGGVEADHSHREMYEMDRNTRLSARPAQRMLVVMETKDADGKPYDMTYDPRVIDAHIDEVIKHLRYDPRSLEQLSASKQKEFRNFFSKLYQEDPDKLAYLGFKREEHIEMNNKINARNITEQGKAKEFGVKKKGR